MHGEWKICKVCANGVRKGVSGSRYAKNAWNDRMSACECEVVKLGKKWIPYMQPGDVSVHMREI